MPSLKQQVAERQAQEPAVRKNPEIDAKIDQFIWDNPKVHEDYSALSKEQLIRKLILGRIRRQEYAIGRSLAREAGRQRDGRTLTGKAFQPFLQTDQICAEFNAPLRPATLKQESYPNNLGKDPLHEIDMRPPVGCRNGNQCFPNPLMVGQDCLVLLGVRIVFHRRWPTS